MVNPKIIREDLLLWASDNSRSIWLKKKLRMNYDFCVVLTQLHDYYLPLLAVECRLLSLNLLPNLVLRLERERWEEFSSTNNLEIPHQAVAGHLTCLLPRLCHTDVYFAHGVSQQSWKRLRCYANFHCPTSVSGHCSRPQNGCLPLSSWAIHRWHLMHTNEYLARAKMDPWDQFQNSRRLYLYLSWNQMHDEGERKAAAATGQIVFTSLSILFTWKHSICLLI